MVEEEFWPRRLWAFAGADAVGASPAGYWDSHWAVGVRCEGLERQSRDAGGWGQEGCDFFWDLRLGQPDLPAEVWAGDCEQPAVCLWLDGCFEWSGVCCLRVSIIFILSSFVFPSCLIFSKFCVNLLSWWSVDDFFFNKVTAFTFSLFFVLLVILCWDFDALFPFFFWILFSLWFAFKCEMVKFLVRV